MMEKRKGKNNENGYIYKWLKKYKYGNKTEIEERKRETCFF